MSSIDKFKYLWDGSSPSWGLVLFDHDGVGSFGIINFDTRDYLLVENEEIENDIVEQMKYHKVKIMTVDEYKKLPPLQY